MRLVLPPSRLRDFPGAPEGLRSDEVPERRARYGPNAILEESSHPWRDLLRDTAKDPMVWFLAGTSGLYLLLGQPAEAATLFSAVVPLVGMDAYLHRRTRASTQGLSSRLAATARVIRDGAEREVAATELVVGDRVRIRSGEPFPADGLLISGEGLQVEESSLTGEAYPIRKHPLSALPSDAEPSIDGAHWGLAGTRLLTGDAWMRVAFTGPETLYGQIVRVAARGARTRTPLQAAIAGLVAGLLVVAVVSCLALAFVRWRQGYGVLDALVSAATLAVAALPEEFPVALTFFLGAGVYRLARRKALVRRAVSVENIGRVTFICCDKTGTLTEGRLRVTGVFPASGVSEAELLGTAVLACRRDSGDPLDAAILDAAERVSGPLPEPRAVAVFPFTEERRRETAVVRAPGGELIAATKGAPELLLGLCLAGDEERAEWARRVAELAGEARKVIAVASRPLDEGWAGGEPTRELRLLGVLACEDPVREGVPESLRMCRDAGIHVLMVTGDHPATARAVARRIGLEEHGDVLTGEEMAERLRKAGGAGLRSVAVVARALPVQKMALVTALQSVGEVVAVTGDGVNDVPALQAADVGIAMGERGTRSAREVAAIVLLDDNFRTLAGAIAEGRALFRNLRRSFQYLLLIHLPLVSTAALIPLAAYPLLFLPIHIVWLELIIHPTAMLAFQDSGREDRLSRERPAPHAGIFSFKGWAVILAGGGIALVVVVRLYVRALGSPWNVEHARAGALFTLVLCSAVFAAVLSGLRTWTSRIVCGATVASALLMIQVAPIARRLHLAPLHHDDWPWALLGALLAGIPVLLGTLLHRGAHRAR